MIMSTREKSVKQFVPASNAFRAVAPTQGRTVWFMIFSLAVASTTAGCARNVKHETNGAAASTSAAATSVNTNLASIGTTTVPLDATTASTDITAAPANAATTSTPAVPAPSDVVTESTSHAAAPTSVAAAPASTDTLSPAVDTSSASAPAAPVHDPGEHVNRKIFAFNVGLDHILFRPVARAYSHLPHPIRSGVHNVVQNLEEPSTFINDALQGNARRALDTAGRFAVNTTIGVAGIFDVANHWDMPHHHADLGQTFGVWGMKTGRTVEMPIFGSSNVRDTVGQVMGMFLDPLRIASGNSATVADLDAGHTAGSIVDGRANALPVTDRLEKSSDYYEARRDFAANWRMRLVAEGKAGAVKSAPHGDDDDDNEVMHANP